ncbi:hypothetical protein O181_011115 [Austropuccinia psidii MF-1]|uniref:dynamin GTPase n=1 Tax=Austropuccinia psidii MF-1 TaxID=1389203 RepID=A0A9Q3GLK7_9BASI|nr:hypothetical protein [Austropuccinia psidii MF-1]
MIMSNKLNIMSLISSKATSKSTSTSSSSSLKSVAHNNHDKLKLRSKSMTTATSSCKTKKKLNFKSSYSSFSPSNSPLKRSSKMISTLSILPPLVKFNNNLQTRNFSFISTATKVVTRAGSRLIGFGALGFGSAAYVTSQVEDLRNNLLKTISSLYNNANVYIGTFKSSTQESYQKFSDNLQKTLFDISNSFQDGFSDFSEGLNTFFKANQEEYHNHQNQNQNPNNPNNKIPYAIAGAAISSTLDNLKQNQEDSSTGLIHLTRKLIEIRSLLMSIDRDESLILPSIVVIGSQSSGKSSVLEAIVGHEFLPKGNNMVTRRPLELTLVHTLPTPSNPKPTDYVECQQFGPGQFVDFREVQRRLTRLNLEVPDSVGIDDQPIHLKVYSPNVPDLSLVDLPGYVQISSMDQPEELREKISQLCDKYIRKPNIILSVCAADVDLANSPALRASKKVDPHGYRTIGVVTKLDLVDPSVGAAILANDKYRLGLGYVGVICKPNSTSPGSSFVENRLLKRQYSTNSAQLELARSEQEFFRSHQEHYDQPNLLLGTETLKQRLIKVLEESMSSALHDISNRVSLELEEASYQYKVQYNDRNISAETYASETMDLVKRRLNEFSTMLNKHEVRGVLRHELEQKVLGLLAEIYWSDRRVAELGKLGDSKLEPEGLDHYWIHRLEAAQSRLTKGGIGRTSAELIANEIKFAVDQLLEHPPMSCHAQTSEEIMSITEDILDGLRARAADHVEIAVMPYRYDVEIEKSAWESGRTRSVKLMEEEINLCEQFLKSEKAELRKNWRLREALEHVREDEEKMRKMAQRRLMTDASNVSMDDQLMIEEVEEPRPPPVLLDRARRLRDMEVRSDILRLRLAALKSRRCKSGPASQAFCPEIFLNVLADRLSATSTDFINIDLSSRFFSTFPHELNLRLVKRLEGDLALEFARENIEVRKHLELKDRKEKLERVMRELVTLSYMQQASNHSNDLLNSSINKHLISKKRNSGNNGETQRSYFSNLF